jgi:PleD family two-component response regulator
LPVTFSAGAAEISSTGALDALESADAALYRAKAEGRDRLVIADRVADPGEQDA